VKTGNWIRRWGWLTTFAAGMALAGCAAAPPGDGGNSNNDNGSSVENDNASTNDNSDGGNGGGSEKPVDEVLDDLGVPTADTPRRDDKGDDLPEDYSPLGPSRDLATTAEVFLAGMQLLDPVPVGDAEPLENRVAFVSLADDDTGVVGLTINELLEPGVVWETDDDSFHPSLGSSTIGGQATRSVAAGDIDGDGLDEIVVAFIDFDSPALADQVRVQILDDLADEVGSAERTTSVEIEPDVRSLSAVTADFDGDGNADLAIGISTATAARVIFLKRNAAGEFVKQEAFTKFFEQSVPQGEISLEMAAGNIDHDNGDELVVVMNEYDRSTDTAATAYWVFDDETTGIRELVGAEPILGQDGGLHVALNGSVSLGDIDADGRDEILLAGLTNFENDGCRSYGHLHIALDDAEAEFNALQSIGVRHIFDTYVEPGTGCNSNSHVIQVRKVFLNAFDVDGDGVDEIQANRRVFEDFASAAPWTEAGPADAPYRLPYDEFLQQTRTVGGMVSNATTQIVTGDVTGDGRENIISFVQWRSEISVWGLVGPAVETSEWGQVLSIPTRFYNGQARVFPLVVPCNVDKDGIALKYSDGEHKFVFTEPILIAALAAAPCAEGIGQNTAACVTAFGQAESQDLGIEGTVTVK